MPRNPSKKTQRVTAQDSLAAARAVEQPPVPATAETFDPLALPDEDAFPSAVAAPRAPDPEIARPVSEQGADVVGSLEHLRAEQAKFQAQPHTAAEKTREPQSREELMAIMHAQLSGLDDGISEETLAALIDLSTEAVLVERARCAALVEMVGARIETYGQYNSAQGCAAVAAAFIRAGYTPDTAPTNDE